VSAAARGLRVGGGSGGLSGGGEKQSDGCGRATALLAEPSVCGCFAVLSHNGKGIAESASVRWEHHNVTRNPTVLQQNIENNGASCCQTLPLRD
jgi:hypothetical protein